LAHELAALRREVHDREADTELVLALRRVLYGLYQLVTVHLAKEEQVYVPLLENGLSADEAEMLFADMHAAAEIHGTGTHAA
jgi:iron-sulfur cluster repair protein YtfE (RIC family)